MKTLYHMSCSESQQPASCKFCQPMQPFRREPSDLVLSALCLFFWSPCILSQHWPEEQNRKNKRVCVCVQKCVCAMPVCVRIGREWVDITAVLSRAVYDRPATDELNAKSRHTQEAMRQHLNSSRCWKSRVKGGFSPGRRVSLCPTGKKLITFTQNISSPFVDLKNGQLWGKKLNK